MNIKIFEFNPIAENTYVLYDETNECVIIDAGCFYPDEKQELLDFILDNNLVVKHLLNTHLHFDHVFGNKFILDQFHLKTKAHQADQFLLEGMPAQMRMFGFKDGEDAPEIGTYIKENDTIEFGNQKLLVLEVPGHSPGSVAFYSAEGNCAIVGDALFRGSIGRTDLAQGNQDQLLQAIRQKLFTLPAETVVYPGHGPKTTIAQEMRSNPFFGGR
ncbi:glyoxylase-like metal-dependent hydrolase (beta-lactamase superfamily II) [Dysgonomonas alginatilytica]|uniref:Glyoxylase-like metal-dependent hydrolase (Beta-lactamase superfamily II) n=1 Tax=Dysgonomonas alginatilytica TaxID=1605892 RepID=A0A2V3PSX7_9BACT|nr:MBL fold metallo-hydrolase [Dysgonomonas alginatilytica]PXV68183.1 glyoxylase-like metal-dependent hydrolase (beta-lactamase superfamily II) [Dysgonomonas alginatilytica]